MTQTETTSQLGESAVPDPRQVKIPSSVTITITSCGRLDLLALTLASFRRFNSGGVYIVSEDSTDPVVIEQVRQTYPDMMLLSGPNRLGVMGSIDRLYSAVTTEHIFHLEDDWEFDGPVDWGAAISLLDQQGPVVNVCVRGFDEIKPKWRRHSDPLNHAGAEFAIMRRDAHPEFFGWSPNPGLIRHDFYVRHGPFSRVLPDQMSAVVKQAGGAMAFLLPGVARHIGAGRNVVDPTMPNARPKSRPAKWIATIKKQLYYMGLRREPF